MFKIEDSPAMASALSKVTSAEEFRHLADLYCLAASFGACDEGKIRRKEDVSFNPRPARIVQLLMKEAGINQIVFIAGAILSCATTEISDLSILSEQELLTFSNTKSLLCLKDTPAKIKFDTEESQIFLAHILDEVRHLHMTIMEEDEMNLIVTRAESVLAHMDKQGIETRLKILLQNAHSKFKNMLQ